MAEWCFDHAGRPRTGNRDSQFVRHEACPACGGGDPLARYTDGHGYCFNCGYFESGDRTGFLHLFSPDVEIVEKPLGYPADAQNEIPVKPLTWIKQYGILNAEIVEHRLQWSPERELLLFPYYGEGDNLVAWQGRSFKAGTKKWHTKGAVKDLLHIIGRSSTIVLVEDVVSAIKVGRVAASMPLFGTSIPLETLQRLSTRFHELVIWLDMDAKHKAAQAVLRASQLPFSRVSYVATILDPKACSEEEIRHNVLGR